VGARAQREAQFAEAVTRASNAMRTLRSSKPALPVGHRDGHDNALAELGEACMGLRHARLRKAELAAAFARHARALLPLKRHAFALLLAAGDEDRLCVHGLHALLALALRQPALLQHAACTAHAMVRIACAGVLGVIEFGEPASEEDVEEAVAASALACRMLRAEPRPDGAFFERAAQGVAAAGGDGGAAAEQDAARPPPGASLLTLLLSPACQRIRTHPVRAAAHDAHRRTLRAGRRAVLGCRRVVRRAVRTLPHR
jgi:hypothetical protein